jgi:DNA-binding transcriptional MerR regulator
MFDVLPSAINFYTREGLLKEDGRTQGGYRLYNPDKALRTLQKIEDLQNKRRLSVAEIKKLL